MQRIVYSATDVSARAFLILAFRKAGLDVRADAAGNLFGRWHPGGVFPPLTDDGEPAPVRVAGEGAVATGSHFDAIPGSGIYDGTVGVLGALAAVTALRGAGYTPAVPIDVVAFTSEEPTRFGVSCLGSRLLAGALAPAAADALVGTDGVTLAAARADAGYTGPLDDVRLPDGAYASFLELHIEQGARLESAATPIGVVTAIAAPAAGWANFSGGGGHAGGAPMASRSDAALAAAEVALAAEAAAVASGGDGTVATVGVWDVSPGAVNAVPAAANVSFDVRDPDGGVRDAVVAAVRAAAEAAAARRGLALDWSVVSADPPASSDGGVVSAVEAAAAEAGLRSMRLVSRAYHDTLFMARVARTGMVFVPCRGGVSHRPDEFVSEAHLRGGVEVLARSLAKLAGRYVAPAEVGGGEVEKEL
ncbi:hypothetical protein BU14_0230s0021 [Porphyra umbilicalis]|uniref:Peptidase M20 dimerisation domain-containing protein n=1 Tax=Porphyra umbilicalis TaxID=2786 RepID=A0A1X6P424_PORUM|nr:hypothetical protein BU14_0230s0021 [Porphyra umbilicalis]|eukprot:OSX75598.1 hypothetical protein BU14_0230s0021 [Porphyra umbilicalis]